MVDFRDPLALMWILRMVVLPHILMQFELVMGVFLSCSFQCLMGMTRSCEGHDVRTISRCMV
jgi:hypothetical protein